MAERDGAGRISQLTGATVDAICNKLRIGVPRKYAAEAAGVAERTILLWLQFGRQADQCTVAGCTAEHHGPPSGELSYLQFLQEVERAEADAVNIAVSSVVRGMGKDWRAGIAWLERRHPKDFLRREHHEITGADGDSVQVEDARERLAARIDAISERLRAEDGSSPPGGPPSRLISTPTAPE